MSKKKPSVLVTFDSMKNRNTGYYYFGLGLGNALIQRNNNRFNLSFYLHKRTKNSFDGDVPLIKLSKLHRFYFPHRNDFNLVHFTDQECRLRPNVVNSKKIMTIHDVNRLHLEASLSKDFGNYLKRLRKFITGVDRIVAISHFVANDITNLFPETADKISVIYNGADKLLPKAGHAPAVKPVGEFIFTIGVLSPQKGFHHLPCLLENNNLQLVIAGIETPHKQNILAEAAKYNCADRVHVTGPVSDEDKTWYYQHCKAFVFPSAAEGFGLPVIEAMHFGNPVFLARRTSLPEIGGDAAYYFDDFNPAHMQLIFKNGLNDFSENNREQEVIKQAQKFSWRHCADSYLQLYEKCLES